MSQGKPYLCDQPGNTADATGYGICPWCCTTWVSCKRWGVASRGGRCCPGCEHRAVYLEEALPRPLPVKLS